MSARGQRIFPTRLKIDRGCEAGKRPKADLPMPQSPTNGLMWAVALARVVLLDSSAPARRREAQSAVQFALFGSSAIEAEWVTCA